MGLPEVVQTMATPKIKARGKAVVSGKHLKYEAFEPTMNRPEVKIVKCIGFQKFRYCGENRPGKKYQDKDFLQLALVHLSGKNVKVHIVCFDAEHQNEIHPNGLVGRDCEHGVYTKVYPISKSTQIIRIPYLRTERILTKKTGKDGCNQPVSEVFRARANILPSPYRELCENQVDSTQKYDTTRVCFGIICTIEGEEAPPIFCLSNVVQNASEKTMLKILKLSTEYVSAQEGGLVDIFTTEDGPPLTAGKCSVHVEVLYSARSLWNSSLVYPTQDEILYKRVVTYRIPEFTPNPATDATMKATIVLSCIQSGQECRQDFYYEPGADSAKRIASIHSNKPLRKRPYVPSPHDEYINTNGSEVDIKMRMKEKLARSRQSIDTEPTAAPANAVPNNHVQAPVPVTMTYTVPQDSVSAQVATPVVDGGIPLHQQEDLIMAHDLQTGEIVYIRTQGSRPQTGDVVIFHDQPGLPSTGSLPSLTLLSDAPRAVAVPMSEWNTGVTPTITTSTSIIHSLDPAPILNRKSIASVTPGPGTRRKSKSVVSPWIVDEPKNSTPLMNGDISFSPSRLSAPTSQSLMKQEPMDAGPPVLSSREFHEAVSQGVVFSLPSNVLLSNSNLPSLSGLFSSSMLDGEGSLLSSSVFEMVQPYIENKTEKS